MITEALYVAKFEYPSGNSDYGSTNGGRGGTHTSSPRGLGALVRADALFNANLGRRMTQILFKLPYTIGAPTGPSPHRLVKLTEDEQEEFWQGFTAEGE